MRSLAPWDRAPRVYSREAALMAATKRFRFLPGQQYCPEGRPRNERLMMDGVLTGLSLILALLSTSQPPRPMAASPGFLLGLTNGRHGKVMEGGSEEKARIFLLLLCLRQPSLTLAVPVPTGGGSQPLPGERPLGSCN